MNYLITVILDLTSIPQALQKSNTVIAEAHITSISVSRGTIVLAALNDEGKLDCGKITGTRWWGANLSLIGIMVSSGCKGGLKYCLGLVTLTRIHTI